MLTKILVGRKYSVWHRVGRLSDLMGWNAYASNSKIEGGDWGWGLGFFSSSIYVKYGWKVQEKF
jgi:hypothetical protein